MLLVIGVLVPIGLTAQQVEDEHIAKIVYLDSIVVRAIQSGFSVEEFIHRVRIDQTFYAAFRNLRQSSYQMSTEMEFQNRRGKLTTNYRATHEQVYRSPCRQMRLLKESVEGRWRRRNGKIKYYTAELYQRLFAQEGKVCSEESAVEVSMSGGQGNIGELKKLLFTPGEPSGLPLIGNKTAIFSDRMISFYDFQIRSMPWDEKTEAYVFIVKVKPEYADRQKNHTVVKEMYTFFDSSSWQVLGRQYQLMQKNALFRFDVSMDIRLIQKDERYYPSFINYAGVWNIPTKKREEGGFTLNFTNFTQ